MVYQPMLKTLTVSIELELLFYNEQKLEQSELVNLIGFFISELDLE